MLQKLKVAWQCSACIGILCVILLSGGVIGKLEAQEVVQTAHSGTYLSPGRDGEGWLVEVLNDTTALIIWFTFTPDGSDTGIQAWFGGIGSIDGNRIIVNSANITSGAMFGPEFDPDDVVRTPWGSIEFAFDDPNSGTMMFAGLPEYGAGTRPFVRLSGIVGLPFGVAPGELPQPGPGRPGVSGTWVDFSHDGEGWFLQEVAPGILVMAWFTFNDVGQQVWVIGTGVLEDGVALFESVRIADGTSFGDGFDQDQVNRMRWGDIRIVFVDCDTAILTYQSDFESFGGGQLEPVRLTSLQNLNCAFPPMADVAGASWRTTSNSGPTLSELPSARIDDAIYVAGGFRNGFFSLNELWRYQPASNTWSQLQGMPGIRDHAMMVAFKGHLYFFGGFISGGGIGPAQSNTWRYDPDLNQWTVLTPMPMARAAGGAVVIGEHIYVAGGDMNGFISRYSPAEDSWEVFAVTDPFGRDHSAVVAFQGELWIMGGRNGLSAHTGVYIFDPITQAGRIGPEMNIARSGNAADVVGGRIVVAGGENFLPPLLLGFVEAYDFETDSWQMITGLPISVHGTSGVAFDGDLYVLLGSTLIGGVQNIGRVQILDIPEP